MQAKVMKNNNHEWRQRESEPTQRKQTVEYKNFSVSQIIYSIIIILHTIR